jgi:hypothetical protein
VQNQKNYGNLQTFEIFIFGLVELFDFEKGDWEE